MADAVYALNNTGSQTITITRGQTYESGTLTVTSDGTSAVDLTNANIIVTVKSSDDGQVLIRRSSDGGTVSIDDAANGQYSFSIPSSATDGWNAGTYYYDIVIIDEPDAGEIWYHVKRSKFVVRGSLYKATETSFSNAGGAPINEELISTGNLELDGDKLP